MQAVCDDKMRYIDVFGGEPGRIGDVRNFQLSPLNINLLTNPAMQSDEEHLLGDGAYTLTSKVGFRPYSHSLNSKI